MSENKSAVSGKGIGAKLKAVSDTNLLLSITITVFFVMYIGAIIFQGSGFLKPQAFFNILNQNAALIVASCGLSIVMITGGIDISVGGMTALVCMCCAVNLDLMGGNILISILIAIAIGLAFGIVQGFLVAYLDIQPFIVTLAGMFFARGMTTIVHKEPFNVVHEQFNKLKMTHVIIPKMGSINKKGMYINAYVEIGVIVALIIVLLMFCMLRWTKLGRSFYAVGGNSQSAVMLGINVKRTRFISHILSGLLAGIAGYVFFLNSGSGSPLHAIGMEMNAIASSIIGGTMLTGGVGNIIGTLFGVLSLATIQNIVATAGLGEAWWTNITIAGMLCIFLILQSIIMAWKHRA